MADTPKVAQGGEAKDYGFVPPHVTSGSMLVLFAQLPEPAMSEFTSRMVGEDWLEFLGKRHVKRFKFNSLGRLERALELLCVGLGPAELGIVRAALVPVTTQEDNVLEQAAQSMEYLGEVLHRVRAGWLRSLLEKPDMFFNVFQPLVSIENGSVFAYEMLIRAKSDNRGGVIGGGQLAEAALASKLIYAFDLLAREVAIRTASQKFPKEAGVFINFMPNSVFDPEKSLEKTLSDCNTSGLDPKRVVFEVVESESIADIGYLKALLGEYRTRGFKFALDDLGSGYSGLNYMLELMPDYVKLDRELVDGSATNTSKRVVVSKLTEAAHDLGIRVIAEGIEKVDDFNTVRDLGVDIVQGYLFAKPSADKVYDTKFNLLNTTLHTQAKSA